MFKTILASIVAVGFSASVFATETATQTPPAAPATTTESAKTDMTKKVEAAKETVKPMIAKAKNNPHVKKAAKAANDAVNGKDAAAPAAPAEGTTGH